MIQKTVNLCAKTVTCFQYDKTLTLLFCISKITLHIGTFDLKDVFLLAGRYQLSAVVSFYLV